MDIEIRILEYAIKTKNFMAELLTEIKYEYFSAKNRLPLKVLLDYFKDYKAIPSYEIACALADKYGLNKEIKLIFKQIYESNKDELHDGDFPFFIATIKDNYNKSYLNEQINNLNSELKSNTDLNKINEHVKKISLEVASLKKSSVYDCGELSDSAKRRLNEYKERNANPDAARGVLSGFKQLDMITNGFRESDLVLVSGSTGTGKSILLMNMAINAWLGNNSPQKGLDFDSTGRNVWFITIENPKSLFERRLDSCVARVACDHIRDGNLSEEEYRRFGSTLVFQAKYGKHKHFYVSDLGRGISVAKIEAEYEKILNTFEPDMIVIDYLGIMEPIVPSGIDWLDQGSCASDMFKLVRAIKKPILTASQMKASMRTQSGLKQFAGDPESVARSKMITDNVSLNLQIEKGKDFHNESYLKLHVSKCRDGRTGDVIVLCKEFWAQRVCDPDTDFILPAENNE